MFNADSWPRPANELAAKFTNRTVSTLEDILAAYSFKLLRFFAFKAAMTFSAFLSLSSSAFRI